MGKGRSKKLEFRMHRPNAVESFLLNAKRVALLGTLMMGREVLVHVNCRSGFWRRDESFSCLYTKPATEVIV